MEKLWIIKNWQIVMEFCDQSCNSSEVPHFLTFSQEFVNAKFELRDIQGKWRNGHGKVMKQYFASMWEPCYNDHFIFFFLLGSTLRRPHKCHQSRLQRCHLVVGKSMRVAQPKVPLG